MNLKMMKVILMTGLLLASGCELLDEVGIVLNSKQQEFEFTIPVGEAGSYTYSEEDINAEIDSLVEANDYNVDQINEVTLNECKLVIATPDTATFDAMASFRVIISKTTIEAGEVIAQGTVGDGLTELTLNPEQADLTEYVKGDNYKIFVTGEQDGEVTTEMLVEGTILYEVEVGF